MRKYQHQPKKSPVVILSVMNILHRLAELINILIMSFISDCCCFQCHPGNQYFLYYYMIEFVSLCMQTLQILKPKTFRTLELSLSCRKFLFFSECLVLETPCGWCVQKMKTVVCRKNVRSNCLYNNLRCHTCFNVIFKKNKKY